MRRRHKELLVVASLGAVAAAGLVTFLLWAEREAADQSQVDLGNPAQIALGRSVYTENCASCHGANLEGQPNWRKRRSDGRLPAPPHDETGHTWHHSDIDLFNVTKNGPQSIVGEDYQTDMPRFAETLTDEEIWAVITFIKSTWSDRIHRYQTEIEERNR